MSKNWPIWPDDQLAFPGMEPEAPKEDRTDLKARSRMADKPVNIDQVLCLVCGFPKTIGLPCATCHRIATQMP